jgi:uncharacterized surface protein with fasciclin (FAS1) repeats
MHGTIKIKDKNMKQSLFKLKASKGLVMASIVLFTACNAWEEDTRLKNDDLNRNLYEAVVSDAELSVFTNILTQTGYDKFLQEEQALTVFAPKNAVLQGLDLPEGDELKEWLKNYIAYMSYTTDEAGHFETGYIRMINDKNVPVNAAGISGAAIVKANRASSNGMLHVIDNIIIDRKNIWEYLKEQTGYAQIDYILSLNKEVMDMERSVQTGVDMGGHPIFDTVWVTGNEFLKTYPLDDETQAFTVLVLESGAIDALTAKYARYMKQENLDEQANTIMRHITHDMILHPFNVEQAGRYPSRTVSGIRANDFLLVDIDPANIVESYQASNGKVYKLSAVDVKMYENKIKTLIVEAENYTERWCAQDGWEVRYRPYASGGKDMVLKGQTRNTFEYDVWDDAGDSVAHKSEAKTFQMHHRTSTEPYISKSTNAYLKFEPEMYAVPYEIYWRAYDDKSDHFLSITGKLFEINGPDTVPLFTIEGVDTTLYTKTFPMILEQKLLISFPGKPALKRETDASISNNFNAYSLMAGVSTAGVLEETKLTRYRAADATNNQFLLGAFYTDEDSFGQNEVLKCPAYGKATVFVANTVRQTDTYAGVMFLDYIRIVPLVDPND